MLNRSPFFLRASDIAKTIKGRLLGDDVVVQDISALDFAGPADVSWVIWPQDVRFAKISRAGVMVTDVGFAADYADQVTSSLIVVDDLCQSFLAFADFIDHAYPLKYSRNIHHRANIHDSALVENAVVDSDVAIGAFAVIKNGAHIGEGSVIETGAVVGENVVVKKRCHVGAHSVIGSSGFVPFGEDVPNLLPCLGHVVIDENVRIGALCTIDRGLLGATYVGSNSVVDNMVHIGHDVSIASSVIIAAQCGFAGFVRLEARVTCGGQVGIKPHVTVAEGARISGKSLVHCDIKKYEIWSGNPSMPHAMYLRSYAKLKRSFKEKHS